MYKHCMRVCTVMCDQHVSAKPICLKKANVSYWSVISSILDVDADTEAHMVPSMYDFTDSGELVTALLPVAAVVVVITGSILI